VNKTLNQVFVVLGSIVVVAGITAVVSHPKSAEIIKAIGVAFSEVYVGGISAALGR